jgi:hypothetical protein
MVIKVSFLLYFASLNPFFESEQLKHISHTSHREGKTGMPNNLLCWRRAHRPVPFTSALTRKVTSSFNGVHWKRKDLPKWVLNQLTLSGKVKSSGLKHSEASLLQHWVQPENRPGMSNWTWAHRKRGKQVCDLWGGTRAKRLLTHKKLFCLCS